MMTMTAKLSISLILGCGLLAFFAVQAFSPGKRSENDADAERKHQISRKDSEAEVAESTSPEEGDIAKKFEEAFRVVSSGTLTLTNETRLALYSFAKQARQGRCNIAKPGILDLVGRAKWDAWSELGNMSQEEAKHRYLGMVSSLLQSQNSDTQIPKQEQDGGFGMSVSTMSLSNDPKDWEVIENIFYYASIGDSTRVLQAVSSGTNIDIQDSEGRTALHWAVDRNHLPVVATLLEKGANLEVKDNDGMSPLWYAVNCEHEEIVGMLLGAGADTNSADSEGLTPVDIETSESVRSLLRAHISKRTSTGRLRET